MRSERGRGGLTPLSSSLTPPCSLISTHSSSEVEALRETMLYCIDGFPTYRRLFGAAGIERGAILSDDPVEILRGLPVIGSEEVISLSAEAMTAAGSIVDTETSSGTSGGRKIRFITHQDNLAEHEFLARLLSIAGVKRDDRVACVDTDPAAVMVSFPWACELLGTTESYCVSTGTGFDDCLRLLERLRPTVLISVPSIIQRLLDEDAARRGRFQTCPYQVHTVIHIGEGMSHATRARVAAAFGAEVFSYYGSSETSAIGIECPAHDGVHLMSSRHVLEIDTDGHQDNMGELIVTTLDQRGLPLLRYRLGDLVRLRQLKAGHVNQGRCRCGLADPRVDVLGRSEPFASILGSKIHHGALLGTLNGAGLEGPLQVVLDVEGRDEVMTLRISDANADDVDSMRRAVLADHADLDFLAASGLLDIRFDLRDSRELLAERKSDRLIDRRQWRVNSE